MKKFVVIVLSALLPLCLIGCTSSSSHTLDSHEWVLTTIQSTEENGAFIAYSPSASALDASGYPDAVAIEMSLSASNGNLTLCDITHTQNHIGSYSITNTDSASTIYEITLDGASGNAVVSETKHSDGSSVPTLIISVGDYTLTFQAK